MDYKDLNVWKESMDLVENIYKISKLFPKEESYTLSGQIKEQLFLFLLILLKDKTEIQKKNLFNFYIFL